ncbi:hypothetical protein PHLCEN_2v6616 [Hermanssonia centrifuga]|uniref:Uncharacterized protein n=1 Tax=Hermanssonia centrifuga TaxID=98765 RepID=A0A2R6NYS9_9APHY|nr:hypothetical protein PHLCEN_2v6616 [Hermanssonia centrifuga]
MARMWDPLHPIAVECEGMPLVNDFSSLSASSFTATKDGVLEAILLFSVAFVLSGEFDLFTNGTLGGSGVILDDGAARVVRVVGGWVVAFALVDVLLAVLCFVAIVCAASVVVVESWSSNQSPLAPRVPGRD